MTQGRDYSINTTPRHTASLALQVEPLPLHELVARWSSAQARPCACGGMILANVIDPSDGVRAHQMTERHAEWSERVYTP